MKAKIILCAFIIIFLTGLAKLLLLRFESGEVYPQYSSLRADPLGTKALFESLDNLKKLKVSRNYEPLSKLKGDLSATVFFGGLYDQSLNAVPVGDAKKLESIASAGGRILFLFYPQKPCKCENEPTDDKKLPSEKHDNEKKNEEINPTVVSLKERWQFETGIAELTPKGSQNLATLIEKDKTLPRSVEFHSALYFKTASDGGPISNLNITSQINKKLYNQTNRSYKNRDNNWNVIYNKDGFPVIMERSFGKGSIVMAADTFFASNEALTGKRQPELLAWLIGDNLSIIFDETHLGIKSKRGLVSLARKYRLEGLFAGIMIVVLLFIWKNSLSLIPKHKEDPLESDQYVNRGRDHLSGFVGLLKRTIPSSLILSACFKEWEKSKVHNTGASQKGIKEVQSLMKKMEEKDHRNIDQIALYNKISKLLWKRRSDI